MVKLEKSNHTECSKRMKDVLAEEEDEKYCSTAVDAKSCDVRSGQGEVLLDAVREIYRQNNLVSVKVIHRQLIQNPQWNAASLTQVKKVHIRVQAEPRADKKLYAGAASSASVLPPGI